MRTWLALLILLVAAAVALPGCRRPQPPPNTPVRLSAKDAERVVRDQQMRLHPALVIHMLQATGPWTNYPMAAKGEPVYQVIVVGELVSGAAREELTPVFVVNATTGEISPDMGPPTSPSRSTPPASP